MVYRNIAVALFARLSSGPSQEVSDIGVWIKGQTQRNATGLAGMNSAFNDIARELRELDGRP